MQRSKVLAATPGEGCVCLRVSVEHEDNTATPVATHGAAAECHG